MSRTHRRKPARTAKTSRTTNVSYYVENLERRLLLSTQQLLANPSFTNGTSSWVLSGDFWAGTTLSNWHTSPGYAAGGVDSTGTPKNNASGSIYQQFTIPASATSVSVNLWTYITTQETSTTTVFDTLSMDLLNASGALLTNLTIFSNLSKSTGYVQSPAFNISQYAGQTVRLRFLATTDQSNTTVFRIDDLNVNATVPDPVITTISPTSVVGSNGGVNLTIDGTGFLPGSTVTLSEPALAFTAPFSITKAATVDGSTQLEVGATLGNDATNWSVFVTSGGLVSNTITLPVSAPTPAITSISPNSVSAGGLAFKLTVSGSTFEQNSSILWNGTSLTTVPQFDAGGLVVSLQSTVPASDIAVAGAATIAVTNPGPGGGASPNATVSIVAGTQDYVLGVDVSDHQPNVNWAQAAGAGVSNPGNIPGTVQFAYVKATQGTSYAGTAYFSTNAPEAVAAGIAVGAYHFADLDANSALLANPTDASLLTSDADAEAAYFVRIAGAFLTPGQSHVQPMLDIEPDSGGGGINFGVFSFGEVATWAAEWISALQRDVGTGSQLKPILYMDRSRASGFLNANAPITSNPLWIDDDGGDPQVAPKSYQMWNAGAWPWTVRQWYNPPTGSTATYVPGIPEPADEDSLNSDTGTTLVDLVIGTGNDRAPGAPGNLLPVNAASNVPLDPILQASGFADPDVGDSQAAAEWQIIRASDNTVTWDSNADTTDLTSVTIPSSAGLAYGTTYLWHVRYEDSRGLWSGYSSETSFTTLVQEPQVSVLLGSIAIQSNQAAAVDFGSVNEGQAPASLSFTVQNTGQAPLTFGSVSVPSGYTVLAGLASPLSPGGSEQLTIELETDAAGIKSGNISFSTNDPNNLTFSFPITGSVTAATTSSIVVLPLSSGTGTVTGGGNYVNGTSITVTAKPSPGYEFFDWTVGGVEVSVSPTYTFTVSTDETLFANFVNPAPLGGGFDGPSQLILSSGEIYLADNSASDGTIKEVSAAIGGSVSTVADGLALFDSGSLRGVTSYEVVGSTIYGGYGGYNQTNIFSVPVTGGSPRIITSVSGGAFIGVVGNALYYSSNFNGITAIPLAGGATTTLAGGNWARSTACDANAIYFVDYGSKDVRKLDLLSGNVTPLISGNASEGSVFLDDSHVFFDIAGNIEEVSKAGGSAQTLVTSGTAVGYCSDGTYVYFVDGSSLERVPVTGGTPLPLITVPANSVTCVAVDANSIFWTDTSAGPGAAVIQQMPKPGDHSGAISGLVFLDSSNSGRYRSDDPGLADTTVYIDSNNNGVLDPGELVTHSDISGTYTFTGLIPAVYRVRELPGSGYAQTVPTGYSSIVRVYSGSVNSGSPFGNVPISSVTMNLAYFLTLAHNFGQPGTFATGDLNGDGTVNLADLLLLTRNFGRALPASAVATVTAAVPGRIPAAAIRRR